MRKLLIAGNWKMNKVRGEARQFAAEFLPLVAAVKRVEVLLCPPFTCLDVMQSALAESGVALGAQNLYWEAQGAFTGEISAKMLVDCGCQYVIIGHSERRHILGENNFMIRKKLAMALENGLKPILCVGETLQERENQLAMQVVEEQLKEALNGLKFSAEQLVIAYEPVWAIGTGINASCNDAQQMCRLVRRVLEAMLDKETADGVRILYGGSVNADNIAMFLVQPDIDGALVGGASLEAASFAAIVGENVK
jgi:triosephosphate isomerase